ncbi:transglycosylase SLT domain-containing protein [Psychrobacter sp. I-STPA6b]|uniref:transglycosylase SLT domain-containing protein n=1 Tax=Psychrobacter sp. I-STPA6b TaxID=2585718 RepID=UPI001D0CA2EF|nr:transglycosylase SLT domain-containing protein [Psychrobacter sp. I-STPA6b]
MHRMSHRFNRRLKQKLKPTNLPTQRYTKIWANICEQNKSRTSRFNKTKKLVQISSIALLSLPAKSLTTLSEQIPTYSYDQVMQTNTLTVAAVKGDSTFFATDGFQHGFGYDLTRAYANSLGVKLELRTFDNDAQALTAVKLGQADMALTTASTANMEAQSLASMNLSCGQDKKLTSNGLHPKVNWSFKYSHDPLAITASHYLCDNHGMQETAKLANFYNQNLLKDAYNQQHFEAALDEQLPNYIHSFQEQAKNYDHDWELLVAMGYQESHLNPNAVSPTGVQGLMMLTNSTAEAMGVSNRIDPFESIGGGARYLNQMKEKFADVPNPDRLWFALASYNMGPNAIKKIQQELESQGEDGNSWANVYAYMLDNASNNSRYVQCMHYVKNIRSYLESIKLEENETQSV